MALDVLNLSGAEEAVYRTVVTRQPVSLGDLAATLEFGLSVLEQAANRLQILGLISHCPGSLNVFIAASPEIALGWLLVEKEDRLKRARLMAARLTQQHRRLSVDGAPTEIVTGVDSIRLRFKQAQMASRTEIRIINRPPHTAHDPYVEMALNANLDDRGIRLRTVYDARTLHTHQQLHENCAGFVDARVLSTTPIKMMLADDQLAVIPLHTAPPGSPLEVDSIVIVHPSTLLIALSALFEQLWERALPVPLTNEDQSASDGPNPTASDRHMLSLLSAGVSDENIAKHLGVSHRTMQRRLRALMAHLDADTRFQAAVRAVAIGWLPRDAHRTDRPS